VATARKDDAGQADVQKRVDKIEEQGFIGQKVDPLPNSAYSLESGPEAPPVHEQGVRAGQVHADPEA
jgi:hypothetical protein